MTSGPTTEEPWRLPHTNPDKRRKYTTRAEIAAACEQYLPFACSIAAKWRRKLPYGFELDDLKSYALEGLLVAVTRYADGWAFVKWVKRIVTQHVRGYVVAELRRRAARRAAGFHATSLYTHFSDGDTKLKDEIVAPPPDPLVPAIRGLSEEIARHIEACDPRTREAFEMYWHREMTYQQIADSLGVTKQRVEQLLKKAYKAIRHTMRDSVHLAEYRDRIGYSETGCDIRKIRVPRVNWVVATPKSTSRCV